MILRPSLRHENALLKATSSLLSKRPIPQPSFASRSRQLHSVPQIGQYDDQFYDEGIPGLLSAEAYKIAWTDYQSWIVDRLNAIQQNHPSRIPEGWSAKSIALATARDSGLASMFNYASMAHNNHFFFQCLSPTETKMPTELKSALETSFTNPETDFKATFLKTAAGMFGPGFVWLVQDLNPSPNHPTTAASGSSSTYQFHTSSKTPLHFRILTTYLAGSPYPEAHSRQQGSDMNTHNISSYDTYSAQSTPQNTAGAFGSHSASAQGMKSLFMESSGGEPSKYGGASIIPVLCVNTWEHVWMFQYGVGEKRTYLENWWNRINWEQVWSNCIKKPLPKTHQGRAFQS